MASDAAGVDAQGGWEPAATFPWRDCSKARALFGWLRFLFVGRLRKKNKNKTLKTTQRSLPSTAGEWRGFGQAGRRLQNRGHRRPQSKHTDRRGTDGGTDADFVRGPSSRAVTGSRGTPPQRVTSGTRSVCGPPGRPSAKACVSSADGKKGRSQRLGEKGGKLGFRGLTGWGEAKGLLPEAEAGLRWSRGEAADPLSPDGVGGAFLPKAGRWLFKWLLSFPAVLRAICPT